MASGAATLVATGGAKLCAPHIDAEGTLWALSAMTGEVLRLTQQDDGALGLTAAMHAGAAPVGIAVDEQSTYLCDVAHKAVLLVGADGAASEFVREYEQRPFVGPTALAFDGARNLFVADGGADGETGLHAPKGSVFVISAEGQLLLPLAHESLARPSALAVYPPARASPPAPAAIVFVAEQAANRIVRFVKRPVDVYVGTVFRQVRAGPARRGPAVRARAPGARCRRPLTPRAAAARSLARPGGSLRAARDRPASPATRMGASSSATSTTRPRPRRAVAEPAHNRRRAA